MEPTPDADNDLESSVAEVMKTLPPVVREYLTAGKYTQVAKDLMAKYSLRIDQGGVLERGILLLLMGIDTPDEFVHSLSAEAQLDEKTIGSIIQEVNDKIFVPLRAAEEKQSEHPPLQAQKPAEERPQTPPPSKPSSKTLGDVVRKVAPSQLLEDHEEPSPAVSPSRPAPQEKPIRPNTMFVSTVPTYLHRQPQPTPTTPPPGMSAPVSQAPKPESPPKPKPAPAAPYKVDPYREPIDDADA